MKCLEATNALLQRELIDTQAQLLRSHLEGPRNVQIIDSMDHMMPIQVHMLPLLNSTSV